MCGIAAIFGNGVNKSEELKDMLSAIVHRGEKNFFNESLNYDYCALGMNRLAIVDRDNGQQPILSWDNRYTIVFNGEIYNYKGLKQEIENLGYAFLTDSDTEALVNGYALWGEKILDKVNGMFAFIIYDTHENMIFAARDPIGVKPLYFSHNKDGTLYLASEIKALSFHPNLNEVKLFPPGHYMKNGYLKKYFDFPVVMKQGISEKEASKTIAKLLDEAVRIRVQTDLPIAVYHSGGIDSTAVLEAACRFHSDVTAIIIGNDSSQDRQLAVQYCKEKNIKYIIGVPPTEKEMAEDIPKIVRITESFEPNMIRQSAISYYIAKTAADNGFKVILCGEGADEIFAGYPEFAQLTNSKAIKKRILEFLSDLHRTQLQRVDRTSMAFTTEVREPFLDKNFLNFVLSLPVEMKVKFHDSADPTMKYIFRQAMKDRLPDYISQRKKVVLSEGAGYNGNAKNGGLFYNLVISKVSDETFKNFNLKYSDWNLETKEDVYYFQFFLKYGFDKATFCKNRPSVNRINSLDKTDQLAYAILSSFNTWQFKREQPKPEKLFAAILYAVQNNLHIPFVMYWGKGNRNKPIEREAQALSYLEYMMDRIKQIYPLGARVTLILTDTHATLNGHTNIENEEYFSIICKLIQKRSMDYIFFSDIIKLDEETLLKTLLSSAIPPDVMTSLQSSAAKHNKKYPPKKAAELYYLQNQLEKKKVSETFLNHIFLTYNGSNMAPLFPDDLPIFYMYSLSKGHSEKPWHG